MSSQRPHINKKRHSSSMSFYESHRRRPSNPHRTLTERLMSLSASAPKALKLSMGPRPNNSLRSYKLIRSGDFRLFPPANFANSAILPEDKISTFFMQNFLPPKAKRLQLVMPLGPHRGRMIAREQGVPRPKVSTFRPRHNIIGPKLCNNPRASCGLITQFRLC